MNKAKILVVTGSSGGHIFPALSFIEALKTKYIDTEILLVMPQENIVKGYRFTPLQTIGKQRRDMVSVAGFTPLQTIGKQRRDMVSVTGFSCATRYISISNIGKTLDFRNIKSISKTLQSLFSIIFILLSFNPDVVVGFGSLTSVAVVIFAWVFRINSLIHEQNVIPGRANSFLAKFSDRIAISFSQTQEYFKRYKEKVVLTGNPLRKGLTKINKEEALDYFGLSPDKFTILVMGGSQGSRKINTVFLEFAGLSLAKSKFQVIHLGGARDHDFLKAAYKELKIEVRLFSFLDAMQYAYSSSDLAISRAGATTITEIIYFKIPAIIIPYPYALRHQLNNALVIEGKGACIIIEDEALSAPLLNKAVEPLLNEPEKLRQMRLGYNGFVNLNANELLINEVTSLI